MATHRRTGFTLIELLVVISIIALLIGILLPALARARIAAKQMQSNTQLRGMHQALVIHAQSNKGWYTGIDGSALKWKNRSDGYKVITNANAAFPEGRFAELLQLNLVAPEYLIHPSEPDEKEPWTEAYGDFDFRNFSYALNELGWGDKNNPPFPRPPMSQPYLEAIQAWRETMNAQTPVVADRLYAIAGGSSYQWDHSHYIGMYSQKPGEIEIGIVFNDGHVQFIAGTPVVANTQINTITNTFDNIYSRGHDAQEGNVQKLPEGQNRDQGSSMKMNSWGWDSPQPTPEQQQMQAN